jgi:hypothetical protein
MNLFTAPLYVVLDEFDEEYCEFLPGRVVVEVWAIRNDGAILIEDPESDLRRLRFVYVQEDKFFYLTREEAEKDLEELSERLDALHADFQGDECTEEEIRVAVEQAYARVASKGVSQ